MIENSLFRSEAIESRHRRLRGELLIHPSRHSQAVACVAFIALCSLLISAFVFEIPRLEALQGYIQSDAPNAKLITPQAGTIIGLNAREGQFVRKGDLIATISTDHAMSRGSLAGSQSLAVLAAQDRLSKSQIKADEQATSFERSQKERRVVTLIEKLTRLRSQSSIQAEIVNAAEASLNAILPLASRGLVTRSTVDDRQRILLEAQKGRDEIYSNIAQSQGDLEEIRLDLARISPIAKVRTLGMAVTKVGLQRDFITVDAASRVAIIAPRDGTLTGIQVALGQPVTAGLVIGTIAPVGTGYHAEILVPSRAIGVIVPGQSVQLRLDSYPYEKFGGVPGLVSVVATVPLSPEDINSMVKPTEPVYRAIVVLKKNRPALHKGAIRFVSGMRLNAMVEVEHRTIASWLIPRI